MTGEKLFPIRLLNGLRISQELGRERRALDYELQRRVIEAERTIREARLWWIAVISAVASVVSALTAAYWGGLSFGDSRSPIVVPET